MKKIIDGKLYDTKTAEEICHEGFSQQGDFAYWEDTLYRTKKGQYFVDGGGGPMSKYGESVGNNTTNGSEHIFLVDHDKAKEMCIRCDTEKAIELFGEEIEEG